MILFKNLPSGRCLYVLLCTAGQVDARSSFVLMWVSWLVMWLVFAGLFVCWLVLFVLFVGLSVFVYVCSRLHVCLFVRFVSFLFGSVRFGSVRFGSGRVGSGRVGSCLHVENNAQA